MNFDFRKLEELIRSTDREAILTLSALEKIVEADNAPINKKAVNDFIEDTKEFYNTSIDNFSVIEEFMGELDGESYFKFEALVRNTDGENPLYSEGLSKINKNILIKSWCIDTIKYYKKIKKEMKVLCDLTGARLYMTLDRKSTTKTIVELAKASSQRLSELALGSKVGIKPIAKTFASCTSVKESSIHDSKTIMFDIDVKDEGIKDSICNYISSKNVKPYVLNTKKGYHVFCYKKFDFRNWLVDTVKLAKGQEVNVKEDELTYKLDDYVSVQDNQLGLVYMKNNLTE